MRPWLGQIVLFHPDQKRSLDTVCTDVEYVRASAGVPLSWLTVPPCVTAKSGSSGPLRNITLIHCIGSILLTGPKEREAAGPPEALRRHTPQGVGLGPVKVLGPAAVRGLQQLETCQDILSRQKAENLLRLVPPTVKGGA